MTNDISMPDKARVAFQKALDDVLDQIASIGSRPSQIQIRLQTVNHKIDDRPRMGQSVMAMFTARVTGHGRSHLID